MKRLLLLLLLFAWMGTAAAEQLEILTLKHRTAEQLLPQLTPLLDPGAALTGTGDKLFLRTSSRNLADIRRVLEELDRAQRRLMISVRQGGERQGDTSGAGVSGDVALGRNVRIITPGRGAANAGSVEIRREDGTRDSARSVVRGNTYEARTAGSDNISQQVQTIEGGRAWINVGQSLPLPLRQVMITPTGSYVTESVVYRDIGSGFYAEPRLVGDRVTLEISPTHDTPGAQPGSANVQRLSTTVTGRLGEWMELGGSVQDTAGERAGTASYSSRSARDDRRIWLKVEELP